MQRLKHLLVFTTCLPQFRQLTSLNIKWNDAWEALNPTPPHGKSAPNDIHSYNFQGPLNAYSHSRNSTMTFLTIFDQFLDLLIYLLIKFSPLSIQFEFLPQSFFIFNPEDGLGSLCLCAEYVVGVLYMFNYNRN